jgi:hypothetical protein
VVPVEFDRSMPETVTRLHAVLDAQRAVIRCYPLPAFKEAHTRTESEAGEEVLGMEHFISRRFDDSEELETVALALFIRGEHSAANIIGDFIEARTQATSPRANEL